MECERKRARSPETTSTPDARVESSNSNIAIMPPKRMPSTSDQLVAYLFKAMLPHLQKPNLELEVRLCILCDERNQRLRLPIETPAVATRVKKAEASVAKHDFDKIVRILEEALESARARVPNADGGDATTAIATPAMTKRESHTRDVVRNGVRESFDPVTGVSLCIIKKQRLVVCDICCPRSRYDLRFALNQEVPVAPSTLQAADSGGVDGGFVRMKERTSFVTSVYSFDLTQVRQRSGAPSLEVEIEASLDPDSQKEVTLTTVTGLLSKAFSLLEKL